MRLGLFVVQQGRFVCIQATNETFMRPLQHPSSYLQDPGRPDKDVYLWPLLRDKDECGQEESNSLENETSDTGSEPEDE